MSAAPKKEAGRKLPVLSETARALIATLSAIVCSLLAIACVFSVPPFPEFRPYKAEPPHEEHCYFHEVQDAAELKEHFPEGFESSLPDLSRYEEDDSFSLDICYWPTSEDWKISDLCYINITRPSDSDATNIELSIQTREKLERQGKFLEYEPDFWVGDIPVSEREMHFSDESHREPPEYDLCAYYLFVVDDIVYELHTYRSFPYDTKDTLDREAYMEEERERAIDFISSVMAKWE